MNINTHPSIIGGVLLYADAILFTIYTNDAPEEGEIVEYNNSEYEVESIHDCTSDEEFEQGLSYSKVYCKLIER